jgi:hypothetical protein
MKADAEHRVPLSARALEIVKAMAEIRQGEMNLGRRQSG